MEHLLVKNIQQLREANPSARIGLFSYAKTFCNLFARDCPSLAGITNVSVFKNQFDDYSLKMVIGRESKDGSDIRPVQQITFSFTEMVEHENFEYLLVVAKIEYSMCKAFSDNTWERYSKEFTPVSSENMLKVIDLIQS